MEEQKEEPLSSKWNDWKWQLRNRITTKDELKKYIKLTKDEEAAFEINPEINFSITPFYMRLVQKSEAIRKCVVPSIWESVLSNYESVDPLCEDKCSPLPNIAHRYPDRVLFLVTDYCSTRCRYCTRSRMIDKNNSISKVENWKLAIKYIEEHKEVRDVLISGGDPLTLADVQIEWLLRQLRKIEHVEIIRIGTKVPVVLPMRITDNLVRILKKYHPLYMNIHFTHSEEITEDVIEACNKLANAGIVLGSQTVLLKSINSDVDIMKSLYHKLLKCRVRPYYLYACDSILGSSHFKEKVEKGIEIIQGLRGWTSGLAIPNFVIDAPGGGGKIPLLPEYYQGRIGNEVLLKNYEGKEFKYFDN